MTPIQQLMLGVGAKKKTYVDDVFSTFLYDGNSSTQSINNGIDLTKGGLVWLKKRSAAASERDHNLFDTERGTGRWLQSNTGDGEQGPDQTKLSAFNSNGFSLGSDGTVNLTNHTFASWSFRKASGFFDVVTYTGNGTDGRTLSHSLGSIPGMIIFKKTSGNFGWYVYHRKIGETKFLRLDTTDAEGSSGGLNNTAPTSSTVTLGNNAFTNGNNDTYVAYLFAGGESTAATARSCTFDGTGDRLETSTSSDYAFGTNDFTMECWFKADTVSGNYNFQFLIDRRTSANSEGGVLYLVDGQLSWWVSSSYGQLLGGTVEAGQWYHAAIARNSGTTKMFLNGKVIATKTNDSHNFNAQIVHIGGKHDGSHSVNGKISNVRIINGTAAYTSSFRVPTQPLTNITNTKLLCCNNSSETGTTVGTISKQGDVAASTDSPFDDPAAFVFGENEDQNVIKCGSYVGNGSTTGDGPEVFVGFEPQWVYIKWADGAEGGNLFDSMRGIVTGANDKTFTPHGYGPESTTDAFELTPTGFKIKDQYDYVNNNGTKYIYIAIRRSDGYCGKPIEDATKCFAMDTGNSSATQAFTSGFPVDFALNKQPATQNEYQWEVGARLMQGKFLYTWKTDAEISYSDGKFDDNTGWLTNNGYTSTWQSWMWKRHAGFDVVCYEGNSNNTDGANAHRHSLAKPPEMIWIKARSGGTYSGVTHWSMSHKGLNGGTNPWQYTMQLNQTNAEAATSNFGNTAPTSEVFYVGEPGNARTNHASTQYIAMLFASVDGISKVGSYTGNGSTTGPVISLGFAPRLIMIKRSSGDGDWYILDTVRGLTSSSNKLLKLNDDDAQSTPSEVYVEPSSTGFQLKVGYLHYNYNNEKYIYYAHA